MKYLLIENKGEIHEDALVLMGGSTKRQDDSKLGHFGSGNKYTIAAFLRMGIIFKIFSGIEEIKITTIPYNYRNTNLDKICINDKITSLTVQMGPDWNHPWMCIREWVQNAVDEGQMNVVNNIETVEGKTDKTRCYIQINEEIEEVVNNWDTYFTFDRIDGLQENKEGIIFPNLSEDGSLVLFSRGIKCTNYKGLKSLYHYDGNIEMNESRIIKNDWRGKEIIGNCLATSDNYNIIYSILKSASKDGMFENTVWEDWLSIKPLNSKWKEAIGNKRLIVAEVAGWFTEEQEQYDHFIVCDKLCKRIRRQFPDVIIYGLTDDGDKEVLKREVEIDKRKQFLLNECQRFFDESGYVVDYPIKVVRFDDGNKLGLAEKNTIFLSEKLFDMGKREIAVTIIEENEHLITKYKDCSRAFQQHFINKFISQMEERVAFFL